MTSEIHRRFARQGILTGGNQAYFDFASVAKKRSPQIASLPVVPLVEQQRAHWATLHTTPMDSTQFKLWCESIPGECMCSAGFKKIVESNPPRFDDWQRWSFEAHNAVNFKLGKPDISFDEACQQWNWNTNKEAKNASTEDSS